jgi:hypothetical protein
MFSTKSNINNEPIDEKITQKLTTICKSTFRGSGGPTYDGWYFKLFHDSGESLKVTPELEHFYCVNDKRTRRNFKYWKWTS